MIELQIIILGIIQGLTEFLPISSSAHLILVSQYFENDQGLAHDIAVHLGTLIAVIFYLRDEIKKIIFEIIEFLRSGMKKNQNLFLKIIISTLPSIFVGTLVYIYFVSYLRNINVIAFSCIIFGIILLLADKNSKSNKNFREISYYEAFIIGIFQCLAFIPGASRSGVVISGSRILGLSRQSAAIYSMLLSIPIILASMIIIMPEFLNQDLDKFNLSNIFISVIISSITAFLSIKFMMNLVKKYTYNFFVSYRIILGIILLLWI